MKTRILLIVSCFCLFVSCKQNQIYRKIDDNFSENRWEQKDAKNYDFSIDDESKLYDINFLFGHVYDYQFEQVPIYFKIIDPTGKEENFSIDLKIKDSNGKDLGGCSGDFCDLKQLLKEKAKLQKGNYKIIVSQHFKGPYLPNVLAIGIEVNALN
jgi:gliding motility-associated lipoprotein GldH